MNPYISIEKESKLMNISLETNEKETKNKNINVRNQHLKDLSYGPISYVKELHTYFFNEYKFHT